ncbi:hypothetical protein C5167_008015 [Papaver somniferum]|uniref:Uncharacterized protein n=1 Tax=Papaver somniferum TaxID=3469 RepID=A0A4Y7JX85_PAPSO|nr:hypothetical protein C5167_008015 [Papaver somniferum]
MSEALTQRGKNDINSTTALLQKCVESIEKLEKKIRDCYAEPIHLESKEFVEMMVIDGLFIVGLFQHFGVETPAPDEDPLAHNPWGRQNLTWDLLLLENQIPMFVLESLYKLTASEEQQNAKTIGYLSYDAEAPPPLPLLRRALRVPFKILVKIFLPKPKTLHTSRLYMASATQLDLAGIKIVKSSTEASFLDISFKDGILTIPPVGISARIDPLLRNLIADEQFSDRLLST